MNPIPNAVPVVLGYSDVEQLLWSDPRVFPSDVLKHPEDLACLIYELQFLGSGLCTPPSVFDARLAWEVNLSVANWRLTHGFEPIGLFDRFVPYGTGHYLRNSFGELEDTRAGYGNAATQLVRWRLPKPLYLPQGASFQVTARMNPAALPSIFLEAPTKYTRFGFSAIGVALPAGSPVQRTARVPYLTSWTSGYQNASGIYTSPEDALRNDLGREAALEWLMGLHLNYGDGDLQQQLDVNGVPSPYSPLSALDFSSLLQLTSSAWDVSPVPNQIPFQAVFSPMTGKLQCAGRPVGVSERLLASLNLSGLASGASERGAHVGIGMMLSREEQVL